MRTRAALMMLLLIGVETRLLHASNRHGGGHGSHGGSSAASGGTVHVQGYYRKDGTYVHSYDRSAPGQGQTAYGSTGSSTAKMLGLKGDLGPGFLEDPIAKVLVFKEGGLLRVEGSPEIRGRVVAYRDNQRRFLSVPVVSVDLSTTQSSNDRIDKIRAVRRTFVAQSGFPRGRAGYVIDYIVPPACGGGEETSNLQWEREDEARLRDSMPCGSQPH